MLTDSQIEALATALLAVGGWPPDRLRRVLPQLREAGLLTPSAVAVMDIALLTTKLASAGYARGIITSMYGERLQALMRQIDRGDLDELVDLARANDRDAFIARLLPIRGIGPRVASNAWDLFTLDSPQTT